MAKQHYCPDCGQPISFQPTGWWTHDDIPFKCWRFSYDGPNPVFTPPEDEQCLTSD